MQATGVPHAEALSRGALETEHHRCLGHALVAVQAGDLAGYPRADGSVAVADVQLVLAAAQAFDGGLRQLDHLLGQQALVERRVFLHLAELRLVGRDQLTAQQRSEIQVLLLGGLAGEDLQQVGAADQLAQAAHAEARQPLAGFRGDEGEEVDHHRGGADEVVLAQLVVLRRHAGGAVVQVADAQVLAAQGDHRRGAEAEALGAENGRLDHVQAGLQAAIGLHPDLAAQVVAAQGLVGFRQAQFPGRAGVLDRGDRRGTGTAVVAGDGDQVRIGLGHAGGDGADARLGYQLHRYQRLRVDLLEVEDQLRQVFDGVDVVVRRRRDQGHAGHRIAQAGDQAVDLAARQLAALAGLGALGHLDLQDLGVDQVFRGHAEAAGSHLLDLRTLQRAVARRVLAALAGVGATAQGVHRLGQRLVGLRRQRAEGNPGGIEALEDGFQRLHLVERQRLRGGLHLQQVADHRHWALVHQRGVFLELLVVALLHGSLQGIHHIRVVGVVFAAIDELQQAALLDRLAVAPGLGGQELLLVLDIDEARALDAAGDSGEAQVGDLVGQAHRLEQLRATVGRDGGDAHLRENLHQALGDPLAVVLEHLVEVAQHFTGADQVGQHLVGEERIDRRGAEADQHREMVRIAGGGGLHQDVGVAAQPGLHQAVVHRTDGQGSMHRQFAGSDMAVAEDQQHLAAAHGLLGLVGDVAHRGLQAHRLVVVEVDEVAVEARAVQGHDGPPLRRRDHRSGEDRLVGMVRGFLENVLLDAQAGFQGHHDGFAQRVDRRVGDLGELLAEVIVRRADAPGEDRHRRIVAHGAHRFLALLAERTQHLVTLLEGDLEHLHELLELVGVVAGHAMVVVQGRLDAQGILPQPLLVGMARLQAVVDVVAVQDLAGLGVHREDLPRTDATLGDDVLGLVVPDADLRGQGDVAVLRGDPARRAQAIAVEQADGIATVGQHDAGGAIPGLHVQRVVLVERAQVGVHGLDILPGRRDDHAQAAEQVHAAGDHQFEHVVHARRVGADAVHQRA
ncbi:hypothetical protein PAERUG_E5_London_17_VIM_2_12_12_05776 [Pseudomonas aeruginosa]|nr:hypothetical protein PAERUG_E5_London_17_VIM_2_12_12_05776 [Pseudomonas aeruginosa]